MESGQVFEGIRFTILRNSLLTLYQGGCFAFRSPLLQTLLIYSSTAALRVHLHPTVQVL